MGDIAMIPITGDDASQDLDNPLHREPAFTPRRKLKIVTVGAGFSALIFAHKLQHERPEFQHLVTHKIFELRNDIGGTWLINRYPGVQCDVPAHVYV
jgi:cation diffusion facilitator CzcD-associated flavoprotein CzcO